MAGISFSGIASGIQSADIIDALMDVQKIPRDLMASKQKVVQNQVTQLQNLNAALQELGTLAKTNATAGALAKFVATSSSDKVTVTAGAKATPISSQIVVDQVAKAHSVVTGAVKEYGESPLVFTVRNSDGDLVEIRPASGDPADVAKALTASAAGVTAAAVAAGTDVNGAKLYRLQITSSDTGADQAFEIFLGDAAQVEANTATNLATAAGGAVVSTAQDASVRLWAGTASEQTITSKTNTFVNLFPDIDVTVKEASTTPVTVTVSSNAEERTKTAETFVKQLASMLSGIQKGLKATPATSSGETTTLGVFTGDSTVRALQSALSNAIQYPVDGSSPSEIGISIDRYGVLSFDSKKFNEALAADPEKVEAVFAGVAARVEGVTKTYADKYDGILTKRIEGQQSEVRTLGTQVERMDVRLTQRRATLERQFVAMESMLGRLQAQSAQLASSIAGLPKYNND